VTLRKKTFASITITTVLLTGRVLLFVNRIVPGSFRRLEEHNIQQNARQTNRQLDDDVAKLAGTPMMDKLQLSVSRHHLENDQLPAKLTTVAGRVPGMDRGYFAGRGAALCIGTNKPAFLVFTLTLAV
jgi:hypothetical protein